MKILINKLKESGSFIRLTYGDGIKFLKCKNMDIFWGRKKRMSTSANLFTLVAAIDK